jgi:hypothetical protein
LSSPLSTEQILDKLTVTARRRKPPPIAEAQRTRALLAELRSRCPAAFEAVAGVDPGSAGYLRALLAAAGKPLPARRQPAKADAALCEADPRCRQIVLDGTGLSGTRCPYRVDRRRPLLPGNPRLGMTLVSEECGEPSRWALPTGSDDPRRPDQLGYCTKHAAAVLRARSAAGEPSKPAG